MKLEDSNLNPTERAAAEKWIAKHRTDAPACANAEFDVDAVVGGYGYKMRIVCQSCGQREDVTDAASHGGYPHR